MFVYIFNLGVIEGLQQSLRIIAHRTVNGYYIFSCFFAPAAGFLVIPPKSSRIDGITQYVRDSFRCPATTTGETTLELQRQSSDTWVSESGASIAETQKKVLDLLNLDEETFLVSSMIFQNDAANFTKRPAGQRKAILAQILQLDQYEELQTKAKKKIYDSDTKTGLEIDLANIKTKIADIDTRLAVRSGLEADKWIYRRRHSENWQNKTRRDESLREKWEEDLVSLYGGNN